ncbi:hypothetical protein S40293_11605 [Stachybotrys chartarum IBT 40293]|nr:hypothetical protein S40293_11605 [Stachybotrys chartarum IBT 40293]
MEIRNRDIIKLEH